MPPLSPPPAATGGKIPGSVWFAKVLFGAGLLVLTGTAVPADPPRLPLPPRPGEARGGRAIAAAVAELDPAAREAMLKREFLSGNVPDFLRRLVEVTVTEDGRAAVILTTPDYVAVGTEQDAFRTPLTPGTAWEIAEALGCTLPTPEMVDAIHRAAPLKLVPVPRPPGPDMTTVAAFLSYQETVRRQREAVLPEFPWGTLTAGHQKDIVATPRLTRGSGKVAIYGWHRPDGTPIQPLFTGHAASWVDYSHAFRLVRRQSAAR